MPSYSVVVTRKIPEIGISLLKKKGYRVKINPHNRVLKKEELKRFVRGAHAILSLLTDTIDKTVVQSAGPQLKIVANYAVGFDNIRTQELKKLGIIVSNTPGVLTDTVADMTWALILATARRIVESDAFSRSGLYRGWEPMLFLGQDVHGKTLGIVGMGRIGSEVAKRASGFNMNILYYDARGRNTSLERRFHMRYSTLVNLLRRSDIITLHVPLLPSTRHLINIRAFNAMKKTAVLINTSRGPVIDEKALVHALQKEKIAGAGLDVFEKEPAIEKGLKALSNVVMTPHIASGSIETRDKMAQMAAQNIIAALSGKRIPNRVI